MCIGTRSTCCHTHARKKLHFCCGWQALPKMQEKKFFQRLFQKCKMKQKFEQNLFSFLFRLTIIFFFLSSHFCHNSFVKQHTLWTIFLSFQYCFGTKSNQSRTTMNPALLSLTWNQQVQKNDTSSLSFSLLVKL